MRNTLRTLALVGTMGLAAAGLTALVGGCSKSTVPQPQAQVQTLTKEQRLQEIKKLTAQRVEDAKRIAALGNKNWTIYRTGLFGDEINDSLKAIGYAKLYDMGDGSYMCLPTEELGAVLDKDSTFALNYSLLNQYSTLQREAAFNAIDGSGD